MGGGLVRADLPEVMGLMQSGVDQWMVQPAVYPVNAPAATLARAQLLSRLRFRASVVPVLLSRSHLLLPRGPLPCMC